MDKVKLEEKKKQLIISKFEKKDAKSNKDNQPFVLVNN